MYKKVFIRLWYFVRMPAEAWKKVSDEEDGKKPYLSDYFYPLIGLVALTAFITAFFNSDQTFRQQVTTGVQLFAVRFVSYLGGLFLAAFSLDKLYVRWFNVESNQPKVEKLVVYSLAPALVVSVFTQLFSELFFLKILYLYVFVLAWEASANFYTIDPKKQGGFTLLTGTVILVSPWIIELIFLLILPGLK